MNVVDSSGWLEFFAGSRRAEFFAGAIEDIELLLVPVVSIYEVYKRIYQQRGREAALKAAASMQLGAVVELDAPAAMAAAELSPDRQIPMADSIIYTVAQLNGATLYTQENDLDGLPGVRYQPKTP